MKNLPVGSPAEFKCPVCCGGKSAFVQVYSGHSDCFFGLIIVRCLGCGHRTSIPRIPEDRLAKFYQNVYFDKSYESKKHDFLVRQAAGRASFIASNATFKKNETLRALDFGAGFGHIGNELRSRFNRKKVIYDVVETNQWALDYLIAHKNHINFIAGDLSDIKCSNYDLIILSHVLEHFNNPLCFLSEISKKMSPEGIIFIETPNEDDLWKAEQEPHLQFFSMQSLGKMLVAAGFAITRQDTCGDPIEDILMRRELKGKVSEKAKAKALKVKRLQEFDAYGGNRRWIRCLCAKSNNNCSLN